MQNNKVIGVKCTFDCGQFLRAFRMAARVAPTGKNRMRLACLELEVREGWGALLCADQIACIRVMVPSLVVDVPGSVFLPIQQFGAILEACAGEQLTLESNEQTIIVRSPGTEFRLSPPENPQTFPLAAKMDRVPPVVHRLPAAIFREVVRRTVFATVPGSARYSLGGVLIEFAADKITAVAVDGCRLARQEMAAQSVGMYEEDNCTVVVPAQSMRLIDYALKDQAGDVELSMAEDGLLVRGDDVDIFARPIEGRFPKWRDVFPRHEDAVRVEMAAGALLTAVRKAAVAIDDARRGIKFTFGAGKLMLAGDANGVARVELPIAYDGTPLPFKLNPRFMCDFLRVLRPEGNVALELRDSESAVVCSTDDGYAYVVMPIG